MANVLIEKDTMTAIADEVRRMYGLELKYFKPTVKVSKSANATGFDSYEGKLPYDVYIHDVVKIPGATTIKVKVAYQFSVSSSSSQYLRIGDGDLSSQTAPAMFDYNLYGNTLQQKELEFTNDTVTFYFVTGSISQSEVLGYYAEVTGFDANGNPIGAFSYNKYKPLEMVKALSEIINVSEVRY